MKDIDKEFIKQLSSLAPIIPVVGKADTMTIVERKEHLLNIFQKVTELKAELQRPVIYDFQEDDITTNALPSHYFLSEIYSFPRSAMDDEEQRDVVDDSLPLPHNDNCNDNFA